MDPFVHVGPTYVFFESRFCLSMYCNRLTLPEGLGHIHEEIYQLFRTPSSLNVTTVWICPATLWQAKVKQSRLIRIVAVKYRREMREGNFHEYNTAFRKAS